ncbi:hypothetical protein NOJ05_29720 [Neorhizobium galegae]|uniref:hypothetical protein n=1 Tax=Neorhizobium galegae TaxID=399 RepID=UPI002102DC20|nr:hypothetical protein [Neorhizobium galegae]MCQ1781383.1 hypothetical protein [Neorhizobium galegae]MCQ1797480.1 hypothetical protein [Neorhizobium galegae]
MLKIISVSLVSSGLATGVAFSQSLSNPSSSNRQNRSTDSGKPDPGPMHPPQNMDNTVTNSTRTNCAPNLATRAPQRCRTRTARLPQLLKAPLAPIRTVSLQSAEPRSNE